MLARAGSAAVAMLAVALFGSVAGQATSPSGGGEHSDPHANVAAITEEAFDQMLIDSVEGKGGAKTEDGDTLRVELPQEAKVLFFTRPGHAAHPGIVAVQIVEEDGRAYIVTSGWWAGDAQTFKTWFHVFERHNEHLSRQWHKE